MKKNIFVFSLVVLCSFSRSQTKLTGIIYGQDKLPVAGAGILIKGSTNETLSDEQGKFSIDSETEQGVLVISFPGFQTVKKPFSGTHNFSIILSPELTNLDKVLVIGYGSVKTRDLTSSVASVENIAQINSRPIATPQDFLQGSVAGVTIQQHGGDPSEQASINIRGRGSVNNESPLWVVDGMPYYGGTLNPNDIQSITVLKDAASAAIYGAQAASGVILVTTKSGKTGKLSVDIDTYSGLRQALNLPTPLTAQQQNWAYNTAVDNSGKPRNPARDATKNPWGNINRTNWIDQIFRTAATYSTNVALRGGGKRGKYSASFNYQKQEGLLLNTSYERLGLRVKTEYSLSNKLKIGQNLYISNEEGIGANTSSSYSGAIINAIYMPSAAPVYDKKGSFHGVAPKGSVYAGAYGDVYNPVALLKRPNISHPINYIDANVYAKWDILRGLKYRSSFSLNQVNEQYKKFTPRIPESGRPSEMNYLTQKWLKRNKWIWDNQVSYTKKIGKNKLDFTGVYSAQKTKLEGEEVKAKDFSREEKWYQYLGNAREITDYTSNPSEDALYSIIGRLRYNFDNKYFLSGSVRRDQTSRLSKSNNRDVFPSVSAAWKMSSEPFLNEINWLSVWKLRASWGKIGNIQSVSYYAYDTPMSSMRTTMGAGDAQSILGYYVKQESNPDLKWETSESFDIGMDVSLFNNRLQITSDYFVKTTQDMIMSNAADPHKGVDKGPVSNVGSVENRGFELSTTFRGNAGALKYSLSGNLSSIKNELKDLNRYTGDYIHHDRYKVRSTLYPFRSEPGHELYSFYLISCAGTFKSQSEIDQYVGPDGEPIQPYAKPGDLKFIDANNDGKINDEDRSFKGNSFPDFTYGFNLNLEYKHFDLSVFFQGVAGSKIFNGYKFTTYNAAQQGYNLDNRVLKAWSTQNPQSNIPMLRVDDPNANFSTVSDWYLEDGSYLRMKNLTVGYNFSTELMNKICSGSSLRIYLSAENLFTLTHYSGMDPEVGGVGLDKGTYPIARTLSAGISLKF